MAQADGEELHLLIFGNVQITARQGHEPVTILIDSPDAVKKCQFTERALCQWWPEPGVDEFDELRPGRRPTVEFEPVVP
jgi:hypothetical protein